MNLKHILRRFRLVYRRSSMALKCVVLATIVLCTLTLTVLGVSIAQERAHARQLREKAALLEQENRKLTQYIADLGTVQSIIRIAYEELDLVDQDAIIFESEVTTDPN